MTKRELLETVQDVLRDSAAERTLTQVLAITDDAHFLNAIYQYLCPPHAATGLTPRELMATMPAEFHPVILIHVFAGSVFSGGIGTLIVENGDFIELIKETLRAIAASRSIEYVESAARCFPGKSYPTSLQDRLTLVFEVAVENCLRDLDERYRDAYGEAIECLRRYVFSKATLFESGRSG